MPKDKDISSSTRMALLYVRNSDGTVDTIYDVHGAYSGNHGAVYVYTGAASEADLGYAKWKSANHFSGDDARADAMNYALCKVGWGPLRYYSGEDES